MADYGPFAAIPDAKAPASADFGPFAALPSAKKRKASGEPASVAESLGAGDTAVESPDALPGALEAIGGGAASLVPAALKGLAGVGGGLSADLYGRRTFKEGSEGARAAADKILAPVDKVLEPETETGKALMGVFAMIPDAGKKAGGATLEATGSPLAATAVETGVNAIPFLFGLGRGKPGEAPPEGVPPPMAPKGPVDLTAPLKAKEAEGIAPRTLEQPGPNVVDAAAPKAAGDRRLTGVNAIPFLLGVPPPMAPKGPVDLTAPLKAKEAEGIAPRTLEQPGPNVVDAAAPKAPKVKAGPGVPLTAVVRMGGKEYEAQTHPQALLMAKKEGKLPMVNGRVKLGPDDDANLFKTPEGEVISRDEAGRRYGGKRTEDLAALKDERQGVGKRLSSRIIELGGLDKGEASDTFGETGQAAARRRPGLFRTQTRQTAAGEFKGWSLSSLVHDGALDEYLPPAMRTRVGGDEGEAVEWLRDSINDDVHGNHVGPYERMIQREQKRGADLERTEAEAAETQGYINAAKAKGIDASEQEAIDTEKLGRARELDPEAVERIPDQVDDVTYMQHIEEILNANRTSKEAAPDLGSVQGESSGPPTAIEPPAAGGGQPPAGEPPAEPPAGQPPEEGPAARPLRHQKNLPVATEQARANRFIDAMRQMFNPAARGPEARTAAAIIRRERGLKDRENAINSEKLKKAINETGELSEAEQDAVGDRIEAGEKQPNKDLQQAADRQRKLLDDQTVTIRRLGEGAEHAYIENYLPHIYKDPSKVPGALEKYWAQTLGRSPIAGKAGFRKQRSIPTMKEARALDLEPLSHNPFELGLIRLAEGNRFIMGTRVMQAFKAEGIAKFVRFTDRPPEGWVKINDKIARVLEWNEEAQGFIHRGDYFAPEGAARIINNYLSPGMRGNFFYDMLKGASNMLNMAQLGLSGFHGGFTTGDAMISKGALGMEQALRGDVARGVATFGKGLIPTEAVSNVMRGDRLIRAYLDPAYGDTTIQQIASLAAEAGGRHKMDPLYDITRGGSYWDSIKNRRFLRELTKKGVAQGAAEFAPRFVQTIAAPIMEELVPRQKFGVFSDLMAEWLRKNPEATRAAQQREAIKIWDQVDDRLGQMVYDNLFLNNMIKDASFLLVRSVGWDWGDIRGIGGGLVDYGKAGKNVLTGNKVELTHRMAYVASLATTMAIWGAFLNYMFTGEGPKSLKDYYFPRTGGKTREGFDERFSPPSYMKDVVEFGHAPAQTIMNKTNPLISALYQYYHNEDFYGAEIRDRDAEPLIQFEQFFTHLGKQFVPFSIQGFKRQKQSGGSDTSAAMSFFGFPPAPAYITRDEQTQRAIERKAELPAKRRRLRQEEKDALPIFGQTPPEK